MDFKNKDVLLHREATDKIIAGINKLCDAVKVTMGPSGRTVIIGDMYNKPYATKDGVSVSKYIKLQDPVENIGCKMAKEAAAKTDEMAGDGTTTASVLIQALINGGYEYIKNGGSYNEIKRIYSELIPHVVKDLKDISKTLTKKDITNVATVSSNNDTEIGKLVASAFRFSKIVKVEEGKEDTDSIIKIDGIRYPVSFLSKMFITDDTKQSSKLEEPLVLLLDCKLDNLENLKDIVVHCNEEQRALVIISEYIGDSALRLLETNHESGALDILPIKTPGFGQYRKEYIKDISIATGATIVKNLKGKLQVSDLGRLQEIETNLKETIMLPCSDISSAEHIKNLSKLYAEGDLEEYDKDILGERIKNLNAREAIIKVGGKSNLEKKERFDRIEDAAHAVASALEEGVVTGGGLALSRIADNYASDPLSNVILDALRAPIQVMRNNGAIITDELDGKVLDPVKVTRCALENAASIALTILGTEAVILNEELWN